MGTERTLMIMSLPSLKVAVSFICLCFTMVSFMDHKKMVEPRPDWSYLGVKFKMSDEHLRPFNMGVSPGPYVKEKSEL